MSSGSTFVMTMWEGKKASKKVFEKATERYMQPEALENKPEGLPLYMENKLKTNNYNYIETATRKVLVPIAEWGFCSSFTVMKEHYNLNAYVSTSYIKDIPYEDIRLWKQAADYIIQGKYSAWMEQLLNNPFVEVLKQEGYALFNKKAAADEDFMASDLKRLQYVLTSCEGLMCNDLCDRYNSINKKEYKLLYMAW